MSFPYHDAYWVQALEFIQKAARPGDKILAPDDFWLPLPKIYRYLNTRLRRDAAYDWAIIHKGQLVEFAEPFLRDAVERMTPEFANEVFVVLSRSGSGTEQGSPHFQALLGLVGELGKPSNERPSQNETDPVLPDPGEITRFDSISVPQLRDEMNRFWKHGGYVYGTERDRVYFKMISEHASEFLGDVSGQMILDLCCGDARHLPNFEKARAVLGIELSDEALRQSAEALRHYPVYCFALMDAHRLALPDSAFDHILFLEAIEHVHDAEKVLAEVRRVLKPGGRIILTVANTDSLHLRMTRKLGFPTFKTNYQHIREFSFAEIVEILKKHGLKVVKNIGTLLYPYWGIPGVDQYVREVNDNDPETVNLMRELGHKAGPEYTYSFMILAEKTA